MQRLIDGPFPLDDHCQHRSHDFVHHPSRHGWTESSHDHARYFPLMRYSPTLRFTVFGAMSYTAFSLLRVVISLRSFARYLQFSEVSSAYSHLGLYAFQYDHVRSDVLHRAAISGQSRFASLIKIHFWPSFYGIGLMTLIRCRRFGARSEHGQPNPALYRKHAVRSTVFTGTHFRNLNDGGAFRFRLSFLTHASRPWPHRQRANIFEPGES